MNDISRSFKCCLQLETTVGRGIFFLPTRTRFIVIVPWISGSKTKCWNIWGTLPRPRFIFCISCRSVLPGFRCFQVREVFLSWRRWGKLDLPGLWGEEMVDLEGSRLPLWGLPINAIVTLLTCQGNFPALVQGRLPYYIFSSLQWWYDWLQRFHQFSHLWNPLKRWYRFQTWAYWCGALRLPEQMTIRSKCILGEGVAPTQSLPPALSILIINLVLGLRTFD